MHQSNAFQLGPHGKDRAKCCSITYDLSSNICTDSTNKQNETCAHGPLYVCSFSLIGTSRWQNCPISCGGLNLLWFEEVVWSIFNSEQGLRLKGRKPFNRLQSSIYFVVGGGGLGTVIDENTLKTIATAIKMCANIPRVYRGISSSERNTFEIGNGTRLSVEINSPSKCQHSPSNLCTQVPIL